MRHLVLLITLSSLLLSACATNPDVLKTGAASATGGGSSAGYAILSYTVTYPDQPERMLDDKDFDSVELYYRPVTGGKLRILKLENNFLNTDESDFEDRFGQVMVLSLAPGDYEIVGWAGSYSGFMGSYQIVGPRSQVRIAAFNVEEGGVTCVGEVNLQGIYSKDPLGKLYLSTGKLVFSDTCGRDIAIARERLPDVPWASMKQVPRDFRGVPVLEP